MEETSETDMPIHSIGQKVEMIFNFNKYSLEDSIRKLIGQGYIIDSVCRVSPLRDHNLNGDHTADYLIVYRLNLLMA